MVLLVILTYLWLDCLNWTVNVSCMEHHESIGRGGVAVNIYGLILLFGRGT